MTVVGLFLSWAAGTNTTTGASASAWGLAVPIFGILVLLFGALGLILVAVGKRGTCIGGIIMGIIAFVLTLIVFAISSAIIQGLSTAEVTLYIGYGMYLSLIGALILVIGSFMALKEAKKPASVATPQA